MCTTKLKETRNRKRGYKFSSMHLFICETSERKKDRFSLLQTTIDSPECVGNVDKWQVYYYFKTDYDQSVGLVC